MRAALSGLILLAALWGDAPAPPPAAANAVRTIDGDTLEVNGATLRLFGLDAPELAQTCGGADGAEWPCGAAAAARLSELTAAPLRCAIRDRYGRIVATCTAGGVDVGTRLVAEGLAWAYVRYSPVYAEAEAAARAAGLGVWQGPAQVAWDWRRSGRWRAASGETGPEGCEIKGNINAEGERIYHTPASPWYDRVRVNQARGQRWFCDEAEAEAAGWRPAKGVR